MRTAIVISVSVIALVAGIVLFVNRMITGSGAPPTGSTTNNTAGYTPTGATTYIGRSSCVSCHEAEHELWEGSHHDLAMQEATPDTVLGDFENATFTHFGVTSTFNRRGDSFFVTTDGPNGELTEYEIAYVFGVSPLQQYLIRFPRGRMQVLGVCWDTRAAEEGGQRWFHLYPDEPIPPTDELHWTGPNQNWNFMCAECHSTNLERNYTLADDAYDTTWSEIDVSCEACHGPASAHVAWANAVVAGEAGASLTDPGKGLTFKLKNTDNALWMYTQETGNAARSVPLAKHVQAETCAPCHSRRVELDGHPAHGGPLHDGYRLSLLDEGLYHADGQILDEVYVYGSFIQSRMYHQGVTCSECHDPHSLKLQAQGNALCSKCHMPGVFDTPNHHHHEAGQAGAACVECHMPHRTYMVVDPRRDHSFRIPRPDLSVKLGTPNACNQCHDDQTAQWAADSVEEWFGPTRKHDPHYGEAIHAGRLGEPGSLDTLSRMIRNHDLPAIARATGVSLLTRRQRPESIDSIRAAMGDEDPIVRLAAAHALRALGPELRVEAARLLEDPVRSVRIEAARTYAGSPPASMGGSDRLAFDRAIQECIEAELTNAERPEAHVTLGLLYSSLRNVKQAENEYRTAIRLRPSSVVARVNLADFYRTLNRDEDGERVIREGLDLSPDAAALHHALGLLLVRRQELDAAVQSLERAAQLAPTNTQLRYVYAVALEAQGRSSRALAELTAAHQADPYDINILGALTTYHRAAGNRDAAIHYAVLLAEVLPDDPGIQQLIQDLRR